MNKATPFIHVQTLHSVICFLSRIHRLLSSQATRTLLFSRPVWHTFQRFIVIYPHYRSISFVMHSILPPISSLDPQVFVRLVGRENRNPCSPNPSPHLINGSCLMGGTLMERSSPEVIKPYRLSPHTPLYIPNYKLLSLK